MLLLLVAGLFLTACGDTATPANPSPTATPNATPTAAATTTSVSPTAPANPPTSAPTPTPTLATGDIPVVSPLQTGAKLFTQNWKVTLAAGSSPEVVGEADGLTFVKTKQGDLYALDTKTGMLAWKQATPAVSGTVSPVSPVAAAVPGTVVIGDPAAEKVTAYDTKTGQFKWEYNLKFDAPNRDKGSRFVGCKLYDNTFVVAISSKQDPYNPQNQTTNPEYMLLVGMDITTGKEVWNALTDPADPNAVSVQLGGVIFGSKLVIVESPDLSVGAIEGKDGTRRWRVVNLFLLRNDNPDILYSIFLEGSTPHYPHLLRTDPETGKLNWDRVLPVKVQSDPPIAVAPDGRTAYVAVIVSAKESYIYAVNLETNEQLWRYNTSTYGVYSLSANNTGVRLRNYGKLSGVVFFERDNPNIVKWAVGGIEFIDDTEAKEGLYLTGKDDKGLGYIYLVGLEKGEIRFAAKTDIAANPPYFGNSQVYLPATDAAGKSEIYAFTRP
jgi:outer membrane protein assembly factor BamB